MRFCKLLQISILLVACGVFSQARALTSTDSVLTEVDKLIRLRDYENAVDKLQPLLKRGVATAEFRMAGLYRAGKGVKQNPDAALALYEKAAMRGLPEAQYTLASMLEKKGQNQSSSARVQALYKAAAEQSYTPAIRKLALLAKNQNSPGKLTVTNKSIFYAAQHNDLVAMRQWLAQGVGVNIVDQHQRSPLMLALTAGHRDMAKLLLLPNSKLLDRPDETKSRPLHIATRRGFSTIVQQIIKHRVDINARDQLGNTALMIATRHDDPVLVNMLLNNHANPNIRNKKQLSSIDLARNLELKPMLKVFNQHGIDTKVAKQSNTEIDITSFEKTVRQSESLYPRWPLLNIASQLGEKQIVMILLKKNTKVNAVDPAGNTALHRAAEKGHSDIVKLLINSGSKINAANSLKQTPLFFAASAGRLQTLRLLLKKGAKTSIIAANKLSPLSIAINNQHEKSALLLATQQLDKDSLHRALLLSIQHKQESVAIELANRDRLLNNSDTKKRTALWYSADLGQLKLTRVLLSSKKLRNINQADNNGYTPLARATLRGHLKITKLLVDHGASIKSITDEKNTLLMLSVLSGEQKMIRFYVHKGADLDARNNSGDTATMLAAAANENSITELLIQFGADLQIRNQDDLNAYQIALNAGHEETAQIIKQNSGTLFNLFN
ncbi:MAG: hypothetical protein GY820_27470 [Gammaproteobacteria bacterium]|nr:hypothetical protein [Gammaproteobacteria bacterium]